MLELPLIAVIPGSCRPEDRSTLTSLIDHLAPFALAQGIRLSSRPLDTAWLTVRWHPPSPASDLEEPFLIDLDDDGSHPHRALVERFRQAGAAAERDPHAVLPVLTDALHLLLATVRRCCLRLPIDAGEWSWIDFRRRLYHDAMIALPDVLSEITPPLGHWEQIAAGGILAFASSLVELRPGVGRTWDVETPIQAASTTLDFIEHHALWTRAASELYRALYNERLKHGGLSSSSLAVLEWLEVALGDQASRLRTRRVLSERAEPLEALGSRRTWDDPVRLLGAGERRWGVARTRLMGAFLDAFSRELLNGGAHP